MFQLNWVEPNSDYHIMVKELIPIVIAAAIWGCFWRGKTVKALCDNAAVVTIINQGTSQDQEVMHLMQSLAKEKQNPKVCHPISIGLLHKLKGYGK